MENDGTGGGRKAVGVKVQAFFALVNEQQTPEWFTWLKVHCVRVLDILHVVLFQRCSFVALSSEQVKRLKMDGSLDGWERD